MRGSRTAVLLVAPALLFGAQAGVAGSLVYAPWATSLGPGTCNNASTGVQRYTVNRADNLSSPPNRPYSIVSQSSGGSCAQINTFPGTFGNGVNMVVKTFPATPPGYSYCWAPSPYTSLGACKASW